MCFWKQVHTNGLCTPGSLAGSGCSYNNRQQSSDEEYGNLRWQIDFHLVCSSCFNMRCSKEKQARVKYVLVWSNKSCILGLTLAKLPSCKSNSKNFHLSIPPSAAYSMWQGVLVFIPAIKGRVIPSWRGPPTTQSFTPKSLSSRWNQIRNLLPVRRLC